LKTIPDKTMDALKNYAWPGSIRKLQNLIERAVLLSPHSVLRIPLRYLHTCTMPREGREKTQTSAEAERKHILATLKEAAWVISEPNGAAARLGIARSTLEFRMRKLGIVRPDVM
jgi:formate hydrogenlyase transcriptional activator